VRIRLNFNSTGQELLIEGRRKLSASGIENAGREAKILLFFALDCNFTNTEILLNLVKCPDKIRKFFIILEERINCKPIAKIIGKKMFYNDEFIVNEHVLDPRPETETLVSTALENDFSSVLDLGTGSGCIVISLLKKNSNAHGLGTDISRKALKIAKKNACALGVSRRLVFMESNWFSQVKSKFDLIVSNPPYISSKEFPDLNNEVVMYEPKIALLGGKDGLEVFKILINAAHKFLNPRGRFIVEVGFSQGKYVKELFYKAGFIDVKLVKDLELKDRVVMGSLPT
jgi:release factor glutamine methyltransferase